MPRSSTERTTQDNYTCIRVLSISHPAVGRRLSWPGWPVTYQDGILTCHTVTHRTATRLDIHELCWCVVQCYYNCVKLPPNTNYDHGCNRASAISAEIVTSDKCLQGEGLVWLTGVVVCLLAATAGPMSVSAGSRWSHLRCSTTGSCKAHCSGFV